MTDPLARIAAALERMAPPSARFEMADDADAYHWDGRSLIAVARFRPLPLELLIGVDRQKSALLDNARRHAAGHAAHDALLWGARGMGKSALVKSVVGALPGLALVEAAGDRIDSLPQLFARLSDSKRRFLLFLDDIGFGGSEGEEAAARRVRSLLEGGAEERPANVRLIVTSNRRNIVERSASEQDDPLNARDVIEDRLALADRFGLKLGFHAPDQAGWLAMVAAYAAHFGLEWDEPDALAFVQSRGQRSGRTAWHYAVELAGRAGRALD